MLWLYISAGVAGGILVIALFVLFNNNCIKKTCYSVEIEGAQKTKIVHISDLHGKRFSKGNSRLVKKIESASPDFIAITGDIVHKNTDKNRRVAEELCAKLTKIAPVYYVAGNHEMRTEGYEILRELLISAGVHVLDDAIATVCGFTVVGLNDMSVRCETLENITPDVSPKILLSHKPHYFGKYCNCGYDLVLCGHAHGGQWRIPFTHRGIFAPGQGFFPKYTEGVHIKDDTKMVISRGLGNSEFPLRLFNRPEIVIIEINKTAL